MDRMMEYAATIKRLLAEREDIACRSIRPGLEVLCLFDDEARCFELLTGGWMLGRRVCGPTLLLRIRDGKVWVEEDATDAPIYDDLVAEGVRREDIVLEFHSPEVRACTDSVAA